MDNSADIIEIIAAAYKDKVSSATIDDIRAGYISLQRCEAECRKCKASAIIMNMSRLEMEKKKFLISYARIASECGDIPAVTDYLKQIDKMIQRLSYEKNH